MSLKIIDPKSHPMKGLLKVLTVSGIRVENEKYAFFVASIWFLFGTVSMTQLAYSLMNLTNNMDDFFILMHNMILFSTLPISVWWSFIKRDYWQGIVNDIATIFNYESEIMLKKVEEIKLTREKRLKLCLFLVLFFMSFNHSNILLLGYIEYLYGARDIVLLFPVVTSIDYSNWFYYCLIYLWQNIIVASWLLTVYGMLDVLTVFYDKLSSEIVLFKHALLLTEERAKEIVVKNYKIFDDIPEEILQKRALVYAMNQCGRHHTLICDYFLNAVTVISFSFFVIVCVGLGALVCSGGAMIFGSSFIKIKFAILLAATFVFLYVTFSYGESIRELGYSIPWLVYDINWMDMPKECHSTLRLIMVRSMKPLQIKSTMGHTIDLENFMGLVKASYTYFNMIYQASQKQGF